MSRHYKTTTIAFFVALGVGFACGDDDDLDNAGQPCEMAEDCYLDIDYEMLAGDRTCLDRVPSGYCTHLCQTDADCCAVDGECDDGLPQVCAPFESTGMMMCFLTCEQDIVGGDADAYCHEHAHSDFGCRSTGGGSQNRKVCVP